jgi:hypothetical protein
MSMPLDEIAELSCASAFETLAGNLGVEIVI